MFNTDVLFHTFSIALAIFAYMVIVSPQPVFSLLYLICCFLLSAFLLLLLECEFLALMFVLVYGGAISILFLFAIMMLESKSLNLDNNMMKYTPVGFIFGIALLVPLLTEISSNFNSNPYPNTFYFNAYRNWYDLIDSTNDIEVYGKVLYSYFVLQFLIAGLILLLVLLGVVFLTNTLNRSTELEQPTFKELSRNSNFFTMKSNSNKKIKVRRLLSPENNLLKEANSDC
jgi:NADH-quinone oxidoreductase subunit J